MKVIRKPSLVFIWKPGGPAKMLTLDLIGDRWSDYLGHLAEAKRSEARGDDCSTNRAIRAAIIAMWSHVDGLLMVLESALVNGNVGYLMRGRSCDVSKRCVKVRVADLRWHANQKLGGKVPYFELRNKALRNLAVHPSTTGANPDVPLHELYDITVRKLESEGARVNNWLNNICAIYGMERILDTQAPNPIGTMLGFDPKAAKRI